MSLRDKLNSKTQKNVDPNISRAQKKLAEQVKKEPAVRKIVRAAARLADLLTDEDRAENARVIREAKHATHRVYDTVQKRLIEVPDHKTRLAATTLQLAYDEGTPIQRQITVTGNFENAEEILDRLRSSPAAMKAIAAVGGKLEITGEVMEADVEKVHKSGASGEFHEGSDA